MLSLVGVIFVVALGLALWGVFFRSSDWATVLEADAERIKRERAALKLDES